MDVLIVGAGPAGMSAALELKGLGLSVLVVDDQPAPGGRIFAAIETRQAHGAEDEAGAELVRRFREAEIEYWAETEVWQVQSGPTVFLRRRGHPQRIDPRFILLATGAQERPMPFSGWQLPGVMTVGGAQILLKTARQIPDEAVWLAGSGPLLLLYAHQLTASGGQVAGILDTTPSKRIGTAARLLPGALPYGWRDLLRGAAWSFELRRTRVITGVIKLEGLGDHRLERVRYRTEAGVDGCVQTRLLLIHDGVVPGLHATLTAGCEHRWNSDQRCFEPVVGEFGRTSVPHIFVAGDGSTIAGARAATLSGRLAAFGLAAANGSLSNRQRDVATANLRRKLASAKRFRRFLDTLYPPVELGISDEAIVCRCEEVTAGMIRASLKGREYLRGDGVKIVTRAGMGPCQARQCGLTLTRLGSEIHQRAPSLLDFPRVRPPLKPLTLKELAEMARAE